MEKSTSYPGPAMFGKQAFESWTIILLTAFGFGLLFGLVTFMGEAMYVGDLQVTGAAFGLGVGAAVGYVAVAGLVRRDQSEL